MIIHKIIKKLILMGLFLLIFIIGSYVGLYDQVHQFLRARDHAHQLENNLEETHQKIIQTEKIQNLLSQTRREFDQTKITLPHLAGLQDLMHTVIQAGEKQGLKFLTITPQPSKAKDFYHTMPVQLVILGTYQQFLDFLQYIQTRHYFIALKNFEMTRQQPLEINLLKDNNPAPDMLTMNATADFYYD